MSLDQKLKVRPAMLQNDPPLELADFKDLLEETFVFSLDGVEEALQAQLIEARALKRGNIPDDLREPFALQFRFPTGANVGQCNFLVEHEKLGKTSIFVVPVRGDDSGWYMEALFN